LPEILRKIVFYGLLALIALAPLPFGGNVPWAWSLMSLWVGVLIVVDAVACLLSPPEGERRFLKRIKIPMILFFIVVAWIVVQATPGIVPAIAHPIWHEASAQLGIDLAPRVTIAPDLTWDALMVLLAYAGVFWLSARYGRRRENASLMLKFFVLVSTAYAVYGLTVFFGGWETILWYDKTAYRGDLTSTFINRNSYATYAAIGLVASLLYLVKILARDLRGGGSTRQIIRNMADGTLARAWLPLVGILSTGTALMLTHSRAGFTSGMIGVFVALLGLRFAKILPVRFGNGLIAGAVLLAVGGFAISGGGLEERFGYLDSSQRNRMHLYDQVLTAASQAPATGYGYGTFEPGFRPFKDLPLSGLTWSLAHNSYLEFYFGTGLYGLVIIICAFVCIFFGLVKGAFLKAHDTAYLISAVSALTIVGLHALTDFSIQMPAMGAALVFVAGLGYARIIVEPKRRSRP
jgi:O-antigen ligase